MQSFRSPGSLQRFVSVFSAIRNLFVPPHSQRSAFQSRGHRIRAIAECGGSHGLKSISKAERLRCAMTVVKVTSPVEHYIRGKYEFSRSQL
jgi:hypothetical protein